MTAEQLKNSILQMAVQGKLVPQDPNDEPASVLLERIREEKEKLIKDGKIKKEKNPSFIFKGDDKIHYEKVGDNEPVSIENELPFDIPDSWVWVRLVNLSIIQEGAGIRSYQYKSTGTQILTVTNILEGKVDLMKSTKYIDTKEYEKKYKHLTLKKGDIVSSCSGASWGKTAIWNENATVMLNTSTLRMRFFNDSAYNVYLYWITKTPLFKSQLLSQLSGMQPNFGYSHYSKIFIPLPPLAEQYRIVAKIEELSHYIEKYANIETNLAKLNTEFPDKLKKSILQQAVQGKLVPQDPTDEPASILLEKIKAEKQRLIKERKIKKDKNESVIFKRDNIYYELINGVERCINDEIPFDIPDSWEWVRFSNIIQLQSGQDLTPIMYNSNGIGIPYITGASNLENGKVIINRWTENGKSFAFSGDILLTCKGTVGEIAILLEEKVHIARQIMAISLHNYIYQNYITIVLRTLVEKYKNIAKSMIPGISRENVLKSLIPLPPLSEQKRIAEKTEELFPLIKIIGK